MSKVGEVDRLRQLNCAVLVIALASRIVPSLVGSNLRIMYAAHSHQNFEYGVE